MIKKMNIHIRSNSEGLFHDSREDCRALAEACNLLIDKVNVLVVTVNALVNEVKEIESREKMLREAKTWKMVRD